MLRTNVNGKFFLLLIANNGKIILCNFFEKQINNLKGKMDSMIDGGKKFVNLIGLSKLKRNENRNRHNGCDDSFVAYFFLNALLAVFYQMKKYSVLELFSRSLSFSNFNGNSIIKTNKNVNGEDLPY